MQREAIVMKNNAAINILRTPVILPIIGAVVQITVYLAPPWANSTLRTAGMPVKGLERIRKEMIK